MRIAAVTIDHVAVVARLPIQPYVTVTAVSADTATEAGVVVPQIAVVSVPHAGENRAVGKTGEFAGLHCHYIFGIVTDGAGDVNGLSHVVHFLDVSGLSIQAFWNVERGWFDECATGASSQLSTSETDGAYGDRRLTTNRSSQHFNGRPRRYWTDVGARGQV